MDFLNLCAPLNHPAPGRGKITQSVRRGQALFGQIGCAQCHVADWHIHAAHDTAKDYTQRFTGDRRFFELLVNWNDRNERIEGKLKYLSEVKEGLRIPRGDAFTVRGIYTDFKYHDLGPDFYQVQFDGSVVRKWRTSPLWGVGTTSPYGHDGASLSLDEVIRRHGAEAVASRKAYVALGEQGQADVLTFLGSLVLYQTDRLPCDINGDGKIDVHFKVARMDTGIERFNPEWLFRVPGRIEGPVSAFMAGATITSFALVNVREAYGLDLPYLKDSDEDGFPDVIDPEPRVGGYRDGVR